MRYQEAGLKERDLSKIAKERTRKGEKQCPKVLLLNTFQQSLVKRCKFVPIVLVRNTIIPLCEHRGNAVILYYCSFTNSLFACLSHAWLEIRDNITDKHAGQALSQKIKKAAFHRFNNENLQFAFRIKST